MREPLLEVFPPAVSQAFPHRMMEGKPIECVPRACGMASLGMSLNGIGG
ncbi:hypothetical protein [Methylobacter sp.]